MAPGFSNAQHLYEGLRKAIRVPGRWPVYSIGIFRGPSPLALTSPAGFPNPVITREMVLEHDATLVADPFMLQADGTWHMFFETLNWVGARKGEIALATSRDAIRWQYRGVVLAEPFHLSYPYVFEWGSDHYMIPESSAARSVRLYRAAPFPWRWQLVGTLVTGPVHYDNSVFRHDDRWWMLTETDHVRGTLSLFHAAELTGAWSEHPRSPVVASDPGRARPGGRVISTSNRLIRFAQDCRGAYGKNVRAFEITRLTPSEYEEREISDAPVLSGSGRGWNRFGMHHLDPHELPGGEWIACVDGWCHGWRRPREAAIWASDHVRRVSTWGARALTGRRSLPEGAVVVPGQNESRRIADDQGPGRDVARHD